MQELVETGKYTEINKKSDVNFWGCLIFFKLYDPLFKAFRIRNLMYKRLINRDFLNLLRLSKLDTAGCLIETFEGNSDQDV